MCILRQYKFLKGESYSSLQCKPQNCSQSQTGKFHFCIFSFWKLDMNNIIVLTTLVAWRHDSTLSRFSSKHYHYNLYYINCTVFYSLIFVNLLLELHVSLWIDLVRFVPFVWLIRGEITTKSAGTYWSTWTCDISLITTVLW